MKINKTIIVRSIITLALLCGVYTETGKWTTLSLFLIFAGLEAQSWLLNKERGGA